MIETKPPEQKRSAAQFVSSMKLPSRIFTSTAKASLPKLTDQDRLDEEIEVAIIRKEEQPEFNRLKRLARDLGVARVIVAPESANPPNGFQGQYIYDDQSSNWLEQWGLSSGQISSTERIVFNGGAVILVSYNAWIDFGACHTLAHEIGHHIYNLAQFTPKERSLPVTSAMCRFFPDDTYVHQSRDEICAECFAFYLTRAPLKKSVEGDCDSILRRVRSHNPNAANLIESYRATKFEA